MIKKGDEDAMLLTDDLSLVPTVSHLDPHITKKALAEIRADLLQTQRLLRKQHQSTPSEERDSLRAMKEFVARAQVGVAADHASARARACVCVCVWVCVWVCVGVCVCVPYQNHGVTCGYRLSVTMWKLGFRQPLTRSVSYGGISVKAAPWVSRSFSRP